MASNLREKILLYKEFIQKKLKMVITAIIDPRRKNISSVLPRLTFHFLAVKNASTILPSGIIINRTVAVNIVSWIPSPMVKIIKPKETEGSTIDSIEFNGALYSFLLISI
ncbi:MAG: hypothetical protein WCW66_05425 [Patescibacteria group bacterium]